MSRVSFCIVIGVDVLVVALVATVVVVLGVVLCVYAALTRMCNNY